MQVVERQGDTEVPHFVGYCIDVRRHLVQCDLHAVEPDVDPSVADATERAAVSYDDERVDFGDLVRAVEGAGYRASLTRAEGAGSRLGLRLAVAAALTVPLALVAMVPPFRFDGWEWLALALTTPVWAWAGWPFHRAALANLRHGAATMDTLISLGTTAAFVW